MATEYESFDSALGICRNSGTFLHFFSCFPTSSFRHYSFIENLDGYDVWENGEESSKDCFLQRVDFFDDATLVVV